MKNNIGFRILLLLLCLLQVSLFADEALDSKNRLRMMSFEDEIFIPEIKDSATVLINKAGEKVVRDFYDEKNRLVKKEEWKITDASSSSVIRSELFYYAKDSEKIKVKSVTSDSQEEKTEYNGDGLPKREDVFTVWKNADGETLKRKASYSIWLYDSKKRIEAERHTFYIYADADSVTSINSTWEQKQYYYHEDESIPPDLIVYENGRRKSSTVYSAKQDYVMDIFFENGYSVKAVYENGKCIKEDYNYPEKVKQE